jgi:hypothetical protein
VESYRKVEKVEEGKEVGKSEQKVPGTVFLDKNLSRNLVPDPQGSDGTFAFTRPAAHHTA